MVTESAEERSFDGLTSEEERVLRMLHGLSEPVEHELKFAVGANEEARLQLAVMEKYLLENFQWGELDTLTIEDEHIDAKEKIINKLRDS